MNKQVSFTIDELELLDYMLKMYKSLHEGDWKKGICPEDKSLIGNMIKKISSSTSIK